MIRNIFVTPERSEGKTDTGALGAGVWCLYFVTARQRPFRVPVTALSRNRMWSLCVAPATGTGLALPHVDSGVTALLVIVVRQVRFAGSEGDTDDNRSMDCSDAAGAILVGTGPAALGVAR
jgi:hypothetical protein